MRPTTGKEPSHELAVLYLFLPLMRREPNPQHHAPHKTMKYATLLLATALLWFSHVPASGQYPNITATRQGISYAASSKTVTSAYTAVREDHTILANASSAAFTVSLPPVSTKAYPYLIVKKTDSSANAITVDAYGSQTIDGAAGITFTQAS